MSEKSTFKKCSDMFCRVANLDDETSRFSLIRAKGHLYEFDGLFRRTRRMEAQAGIRETAKAMQLIGNHPVSSGPLNVRNSSMIVGVNRGSDPFALQFARYPVIEISKPLSQGQQELFQRW